MLGFLTSCRSSAGTAAAALTAVRPAAARPPAVRPQPEVRAQHGTVRINAGGTEALNEGGRLWSADGDFSGGSVHDRGDAGSDADTRLYRTRRYGTYFTYSVLVPAGRYVLRLHFTDPVKTSPGARKFDVLANGIRILPEFDIVAEAGEDEAADESVVIRALPVTIVTGRLWLEFVGRVDKATVSAIELEPL